MEIKLPPNVNTCKSKLKTLNYSCAVTMNLDCCLLLIILAELFYIKCLEIDRSLLSVMVLMFYVYHFAVYMKCAILVNLLVLLCSRHGCQQLPEFGQFPFYNIIDSVVLDKFN